MRRLAAVAVTALTIGCAEPIEHSEPFPVVHLERYTERDAVRACPSGYAILWREDCDSLGLSSATILCREDKK